MAEEEKAFQRVMGCVPTRVIVESLKSGEKSFEDLNEELNKLSPDGVDSIVVRLYITQLKINGFVEEKQKEGREYFNLTDKWKMLESKMKT